MSAVVLAGLAASNASAEASAAGATAAANAASSAAVGAFSVAVSSSHGSLISSTPPYWRFSCSPCAAWAVSMHEPLHGTLSHSSKLFSLEGSFHIGREICRGFTAHSSGGQMRLCWCKHMGQGLRGLVCMLQGALDRGDCKGATSAAASVAVAAASVSSRALLLPSQCSPCLFN